MPAKKRVAVKTAKTSNPWRRRILVLCSVVVAAGGLALSVQNWIATPDIKLLVPERGARWIRQNRPFKLTGWGPTREVVFFRKRVTVPAGTNSATVTVRALRACIVYWDQRQTLVAARPEEWKEPHTVELTDLTPGPHTFEVFVEDSFGPAALLVSCNALDLNSGPGWDEHVLGEEWRTAALADEAEPPPLAHAVPTPLRALLKSLWWLAPVFLAIWGVLMWTTRRAEGRILPSAWTASRCRWAVLAAWFVLAANNFLKLPADMGYDLPSHVDYIRYIAERGELPDARDGLQMFQAPLFYALAALVYRGLTLFLSSGTALLWLRWIPLLCGAAQVEICFRAGRIVFQDRDDLQTLTVLVGGLLPMNVYMSQTLGNEPLCGVLSALVLLWGWQALRESIRGGSAGASPARVTGGAATAVRGPGFAESPRRQWALGVLFGLDLLTKMSALLLAPVIAVILAVANRARGFAGATGSLARSFSAALVVAGWYYARNWLHFGKPLVGGWDPARGIVWWQDPGYRTPWQMVSFGRSLLAPLHAGFYSMADGFFASLWMDGNLSGLNDWETPSPWNMTLLLAAAWPALLLTAAVAAGLLRAAGCRDAVLRRSLQLAGGTVLLYLAAFALLWLQVPAFSQAKASYTLGLTPAYALLCVAGMDLLPANRAVRSALFAFALCWSALVYGTYFVV